MLLTDLRLVKSLPDFPPHRGGNVRKSSGEDATHRTGFNVIAGEWVMGSVYQNARLP
jgi:hypothetical protein